MANEKEIIKKDSSLGAIRIADEVVSIIAGLAATEVDGIAGMSGGIAGGIAEMLGRKNFAKGVKVEVGEKEAAVDLHHRQVRRAHPGHRPRGAGERQAGHRDDDGPLRRRGQRPRTGRRLPGGECEGR